MTRIRTAASCSIVAFALVLSAGCALFNAKTAPVPPATQQQQLQEIDRYATAADAVVTQVKNLREMEKIAAHGGVIAPAEHIKIQQAFDQFYAKAEISLNTAKTLTLPGTTRRRAVETLIDAAVEAFVPLAAQNKTFELAVTGARAVIDALLIAL